MIILEHYIRIPESIFLDKSISPSSKCLYGYIELFTIKKGYCYASNEYLEKYINKSQRTINYSLSKLKKLVLKLNLKTEKEEYLDY